VVYKGPYEWNLGPAGNRGGERIILGMIRSHTAWQSQKNIVVETSDFLQHSGHSIRKVQIDPRLRRYRVIDTFSVIAQEAGPPVSGDRTFPEFLRTEQRGVWATGCV